MKKSIVFGCLAISSLIYAEPEKKPHPCKDQGFYIKLGSGPSFANEAEIKAPLSIWDTAAEGYNGSLGTAPIVLAGLGYDSSFVSTDITASYRPNYNYKKYQTPTTTDTIGELGSTTRRFTLDVASIMETIYLNGRGWRWLDWKVGHCSSIFPVIGGGVGISQMKLSNFRSTGLSPIVGSFPSFASENQYSVQYKFTYQLMGGFEFRYKNLCGLSMGYRWFDVGQFNSSQYLRSADGTAMDIGSNPWKIKFAANELFIEFKVFL